MHIILITLLSIALSLDSFSLSLSLGLSTDVKNKAIKYTIVLAGVQTLCFIMGSILSSVITFNTTFFEKIHLTFIIYIILAIKLLKEAFSTDEFIFKDGDVYKIALISSIDALIVGFLPLQGSKVVLALLIFICTFAFVSLAFKLVKKIRKVEVVEQNSLLLASIIMFVLAILSF